MSCDSLKTASQIKEMMLDSVVWHYLWHSQNCVHLWQSQNSDTNEGNDARWCRVTVSELWHKWRKWCSLMSCDSPKTATQMKEMMLASVVWQSQNCDTNEGNDAHWCRVTVTELWHKWRKWCSLVSCDSQNCDTNVGNDAHWCRVTLLLLLLKEVGNARLGESD